MPNDDYDDLFDQWGQALNVDPQLAKSVFHTESNGQVDVPDNQGAVGPMQMKPATAAAMATKLGFDPKAIDLHDMRWAVPLSMQYLADGQNATQSAEGALGYYSTGSADPKRWNQGYIDKVTKLYPSMALTPAGQGQVPGPMGQPQQQQPSQNQPSADGAQPLSGSDIAATGAGQIGQTSSSVGDFLRKNNQSLDPTKANWCAAFVNGVLDANGVEGTTGPLRNVATSFLTWGKPVAAGDVNPGDVMVIPRGHPAGGIGGHVGIATGHVADGSDGQSYYLMESGNLNGKVAYSWEPANTVVVRRDANPGLADDPGATNAARMRALAPTAVPLGTKVLAPTAVPLTTAALAPTAVSLSTSALAPTAVPLGTNALAPTAAPLSPMALSPPAMAAMGYR